MTSIILGKTPRLCDLVLKDGPNLGIYMIKEIAHTTRVLFEADQIVEIRQLVPGDVCEFGYFDQNGLQGDRPYRPVMSTSGNTYITLQKINPLCQFRAKNKIRRACRGAGYTVTDDDVTHYRWFIVDIDPVRPAGISSSDEELQLTYDTALHIRSTLMAEGWYDCVVACSGNGVHLLWRLECHNTAEVRVLLSQMIDEIASRFGTDQVRIDTSQYNPSRMVRLYGTPTRKGDDDPQRPHRMSGILYEPQIIHAINPWLHTARAKSSREKMNGYKTV